MKLSSAHMIARIATARERLVNQRERGKLDVMIDGVFQDMDMVGRIRPHVNAELGRRIAEIDKDLRQLGVTVD